MRPPSTAEIQSTTAFPLGDFGCQRIVDWATNRLVDGDDNDAMCILAGLTPPFNLFEVEARRDKVLAERNLLVPRERAVFLYARELVHDLTGPDCDVVSTLQKLSQLYVDCEYKGAFQDFHYLYGDLDDIEYLTYNEIPITRGTFPSICKDIAVSWLAEHPIDPPHTSVR